MDSPTVRSRDELIGYIFHLLDDHDAIGDQWRNKDIYTFLQAMAAWFNDCESHDRDTGQAVDGCRPTWQMFADALSAASCHE